MILAQLLEDYWILAIAALVAICCSQVGLFLVVRKAAMLGDAISHSILLGLFLGFVISGGRSLFPMLAGAVLIGLLTTYLTGLLQSKARLMSDASIGISFTFLFAVGVILVSAFAGQVDLDQDCILFGELVFAPFDRWEIAGIDIGPRAFWMQVFMLFTTMTFIIVSYRRLQLTSFDPLLAKTLGVRVTFWHYALMTAVALVTVTAFEAVGVILVITLLVAPANCAILLASSLKQALILSAAFAFMSAIFGYFVAVSFDNSVAVCMALASAAIFLLVLLLSQLQRRVRA